MRTNSTKMKKKLLRNLLCTSLAQRKQISWLNYDVWRKTGFCPTTDSIPSTKPKWLQKKVRVIVWVSVSAISHYNFLHSCETITEKYCEEIVKIHKELHHFRPALTNRIYHEIARPNVLQKTLQKLNNRTTVLYFTQLTDQTSCWPIISSSRISTIYRKKRSSVTKQQFKPPSKISLVPGL